MIHDSRGASVLLDPLRLQMLQRLREPESASGLARQLKLPRQKVNYHLRELEKHGLVIPVEERRKGNCVERFMRATAASYLISPEALGTLSTDPSRIQDRFSSAYLVALASKIIGDLSYLRNKSEQAGKQLATFSLQSEVSFASASDRNAFTQELSNEIARLIAKYHNEKNGSRRFHLVVAAYPSITKNTKKEKL